MWALDNEFCPLSMSHRGSMESRGLKPIPSHLRFTSWVTGFHMLSLTFINLGCEQNLLLIVTTLEVSNLMEHLKNENNNIYHYFHFYVSL
jgi:hypothetical protein